MSSEIMIIIKQCVFELNWWRFINETSLIDSYDRLELDGEETETF